MITPATLLTIFFHPEQEHHALYLLLTEVFREDETAYSILARREEQSLLEYRPFHVPHAQRQIIFAAKEPVTSEQLDALTIMIGSGTIYGFTVKGELALGETVINNLA